jgi:hypothetical protein
MALITLQHDHMRVVIDPDLGAEITHISGADGRNLLFYADWRTPARVSESQSYGSQVLDWLSEYRGGWQELFPNAGGAGDVLGTPLPFHGEISRTRWHAEIVQPAQEVVLSAPARLPLVIERRMRLDPSRPILLIEETIRSEADFPVPYIWGHHPAWGAPLTETGAIIDLASAQVHVDAGLDGESVDLQPDSQHIWGQVVNRHGQPVNLSRIPEAPIQRLCYLHDLAEGWYAIRNPKQALGVALAWDLATFPNLWLWQEIGGGKGMPWYGRGAITALEPASQFPAHGLAAALEAGQAHMLEPGETATTSLTCALFSATDQVVRGVSIDGQIHY